MIKHQQPISLAILGGGPFGRAALSLTAQAASHVSLWTRGQEAREQLRQDFPRATICDSIADAAAQASMVLFAVPINALREVASQYGQVARGDQVVIHAIRGVESGFCLPHQVLRAETCVRKIGALGGPLALPDANSGRPIITVLASRFNETHEAFNALVKGSLVKVHASHDIVGVEVAGAIANVSALAVGMADALGLGATATGVLLARGLVESRRLGVALGASSNTFSGLTGIGDLIPRKVTSTSRHHQLGALLAEGRGLSDALFQIKGEVEGVQTAHEAIDAAQRLHLQLPLIEAVHTVLNGQRDVRQALDAVLSLDLELGAA